LSRSESAHPASANQTLLRCGADRTNQSPDFRLTGSTRQRLRVARLLVWERITTRGSAGAPRLAVVGASVSLHGSRSAGAYLRSPPQLPSESQDSDRGEYGQRQDGRDRSRHRKRQEACGGEETIDYKLMVVAPS